MGNIYNIHSLNEKIIKLLDKELKRRNFHDKRLLTNWKYIFDDHANVITPYKILFKGIDDKGVLKKTLFVCTKDRKFATEFLFYKNQFLEKLNQYFGNEKSFFCDIKIKTID